MRLTCYNYVNPNVHVS